MKGENAKAWNDFVQFENERAFHILYTHYFKYLSYLGFKKGFSSSRIKDGINDLFMVLWERKDKLTTVINFHNYIITIFLRKLYKKEDASIDDEAELEDYTDFFEMPSVESQYIQLQAQQDVSRILKSFVDKLPLKQREIIYQKFYLGLSYKEISDANSISINTVYNTIYKAVEKLKIQMGKDNMDLLILTLIGLCYFFYFFL